MKEAFLVDRAVKEPLIAEIPKEIHRVVLHEKVLGKGSGEISDLISEQIHCLIGRVMVNDGAQFAMKQCEKGVILLEDLEKNFRIFFAECTVLEL